MALDVDAQTRVVTLATQLGTHQAKLTAGLVPPTNAPLFIKNADGSVNTRAGVQVKPPTPPRAPAPAKRSA